MSCISMHPSCCNFTFCTHPFFHQQFALCHLSWKFRLGPGLDLGQKLRSQLSKNWVSSCNLLAPSNRLKMIDAILDTTHPQSYFLDESQRRMRVLTVGEIKWTIYFFREMNSSTYLIDSLQYFWIHKKFISRNRKHCPQDSEAVEIKPLIWLTF